MLHVLKFNVVSVIISGYVVYCKQGKFCRAKLSRYPQYMDFRGNSLRYKAKVLIYYVCLEQKIHRKNIRASLKTCKNLENSAQ